MSALELSARLAGRDADFGLSLGGGEVLAVLGPNGSGKSTLLSLIAGLLRPDDGRIVLGARVLTDTRTGVHVPPYARGVAMLTQQPLLFPHMSVAANVGYGPRCKGHGRNASRAVAAHWLEAVEATHLADRKPAALSGGQAQRIAIARALATEPDLLLLDEPMAALDIAVAPSVRRLLREILRAAGRTALIVTHDLLDALALADRIAVVDDGRIVETGPLRAVLSAPRSEFAARMAGVNLLGGIATEPGVIRTDWGDVVSGTGGPPAGESAVAVFPPSAVSLHAEPPHGSPRNVIETTIAEIENHGSTVRIRGAGRPGGALFADVTAAAAADLDLAPGQRVYFVVKAMEVQIHSSRAVPAT